MKSNRSKSIFSRIYKRILKIHGPLNAPCWIWQGNDSGNGRGGGYGRISLDGSTMATHRIMYTLWHGPISHNKQIDHLCNNRLCCNPIHLEQVTHKQNQRRRRKNNV